MTGAQIDVTSDQTGYGLKDGVLVFIADVPRGLACGCVCARCGKRLIARKGDVRRHHFAHYEPSNCHGAAESVLHLLAKELISEMTEFSVPAYEFKKDQKTKCGTPVRCRSVIAMGGIVRIDKVRVEERGADFIPDLILETGSKTLIVEIAVTHKVQRAKLRRIRQRNVPAIEIQLQSSDSLLSRDSLKMKLQLDLSSKRWLFHPRQRDAERKFYSEWRALRSVERASLNRRQPSTPAPNSPISAQHLVLLPSLQPSLSKYDRTMEAFNRVHHRYPTMEECLRLWPNLWRR